MSQTVSFEQKIKTNKTALKQTINTNQFKEIRKEIRFLILWPKKSTTTKSHQISIEHSKREDYIIKKKSERRQHANDIKSI